MSRNIREMGNETFITLVIHTYDHAVVLKQILEANGIEVRLQNVNLNEPILSSGVRVRIKEKDLPLALRITESADNLSPALVNYKMAGMSGNILIPVDFSDYGFLACKVGFAFAARLSLHPVLLHTFITPYFRGSLPLSDNLSADLRDSEIRSKLENEAKIKMKDFTGKLDDIISEGKIAKVSYTSIIREGVPEEVILDYSKNTHPSLIIMVTRGICKKESEGIGSVTAEVFDSCRVPVFSVPEGYEFPDLKDIDKVGFFCNLDQQDIIVMDSFARMFDKEPYGIDLIPANERAVNKSEEKAKTLIDYYEKHYTNIQFGYAILKGKNFTKEVDKLIVERGIKLLVVPNKRKSIFSRLFNPSIAHKILFERDIPMLVLPV